MIEKIKDKMEDILFEIGYTLGYILSVIEDILDFLYDGNPVLFEIIALPIELFVSITIAFWITGLFR